MGLGNGVPGPIPGRVEAPYDVHGLDLSGAILELGPGNMQLRPLVEAAGGWYVAVDHNEILRPWGVNILDYSREPERLPHSEKPGGFDGIFCRGSISASWDSLALLAQEILARLSPDGWAWISLWIGDCRGMQLADAMQLMDFYDFVERDEGEWYLPSNQILWTRGLEA